MLTNNFYDSTQLAKSKELSFSERNPVVFKSLIQYFVSKVSFNAIFILETTSYSVRIYPNPIKNSSNAPKQDTCLLYHLFLLLSRHNIKIYGFCNNSIKNTILQYKT